MSSWDSAKLVNVTSPKLIAFINSYLINKRSCLGLQQEIAYYLKGIFQIQWETSAEFWREESSLLILLLIVIPQNLKLQHRARFKWTSFFYVLFTSAVLYNLSTRISCWQLHRRGFCIWCLAIALEFLILTDVQGKNGIKKIAWEHSKQIINLDGHQLREISKTSA